MNSDFGQNGDERRGDSISCILALIHDYIRDTTLD